MKKTLKYMLFALLTVGPTVLTSCGDDDDETPVAPPAEATDSWTDERDNTTYTWVRYGKLEWTTTNLAYQPATGGTLPDLTVNPRYYNDGIAAKYFDTFGMLYNYDAALAAVPETDGWRLPTKADWDDLAARTGGDVQGAISLALGGYYVNEDFFQQIHPNVDYYAYIYGFYWTATTDESKTANNFAYYRKIVFNQPGSVSESMDKTNYMSVRLVRDAQ